MTEKEKIKAKFIGKNSLGYENGKTYELTVNNRKVLGFEGCPVTIEREDGTGICPYQTLTAFLDNWTVLLTPQSDIDVEKVKEEFEKKFVDKSQLMIWNWEVDRLPESEEIWEFFLPYITPTKEDIRKEVLNKLKDDLEEMSAEYGDIDGLLVRGFYIARDGILEKIEQYLHSTETTEKGEEDE